MARFTLPCDMCGTAVRARSEAKAARCLACRRSRPGYIQHRKVPCDMCGKLTGSYKSAGVRCIPCRRIVEQSQTCEWCGERITERYKDNRPRRRRFCSIRCSARASGAKRRVQPGTTATARYSRRDAAAGGLNKRQRRELLAKWVAQGRTCAYCQRPADTVDHVVPLSCGGKNAEGNLAPACKPCNSAKHDLFIIEWRTGRRLPKNRQPAPPRPRKSAGKPVQIAIFLTVPCVVCGGAIPSDAGKAHGHRSSYCSADCRTERNARDARDRQRIKRGASPLGIDVPTSAWPHRRSAAA